MLNAARALMRSKRSGGREFPRVEAFRDVYAMGWSPRYGELTMVAARSGAGKSTFGLAYALESGLETLYFSGDMSAFQASVKIACNVHRLSIDEVVSRLDGEGGERLLAALPSNITFAFGEITRKGVSEQLDAYVELHNRFPDLIVIDNLMDIEGCSSDYTAQTEAMQWLHNVNRDTGCSVWVMAHMTDKGERGRNSPHEPAPRSEVKNGLSEKPEVVLSLALNPFTNELNVAVVKNRLGKSDPSGNQYVSVDAIPEQSRYVVKGGDRNGRFVQCEDTGADEREEPGGGASVGNGHGEGVSDVGVRYGTVAPIW